MPNMNPFKADLLRKLERQRKTQDEIERQSARRAQLLAARRKMTESEKLSDLASSAASRASTFELAQASKAALDAAAAGREDRALRAGEMNRRAFFKHLKQVVAKADIVIEVLDARDPLACRSPEIENYILSKGADKKIILVLNKIDLVPPPVVQQWLVYLRRFFPTLAFKASTQQQREHLSAPSGARVGKATRRGEVVTGAGAAGAETLLQLIKNYSRSHDMKRAVTVGIIGYPNVGKSSIINSLKRSKAVGVSPIPGFTKAMQEVQLDSKVTLLDCPGIIFDDAMGAGGVEAGGAGLLLRNCISVDEMDDPEDVVAGILRRCQPEKLMTLYSIARFEEPAEFLELIARKRGKLTKGGDPDLRGAAQSVLHDWNSGAIPFFTTPPEDPTAGGAMMEAEIVTEWSKVRYATQPDPPGPDDDREWR